MAGSQLPPPLLLLALVLLLPPKTSTTLSPHTVTSTELPPTPNSSPLSFTSFTLHSSPTYPSSSTGPFSMSSATADGTSVASGLAPGDTGAPKLHRNPGVVVAVCLLVSILLIGSVVMAVKCCHKDMSEFQRMDEETVH
ncbi:hypothetical protein CB1_000172063 [Camelus ferus]|nr:hypothetical protein CB1_000172063 [Camelus ferus]